jgi:FKBP-type peptidyl-prolyl cis-trans isomerase
MSAHSSSNSDQQHDDEAEAQQALLSRRQSLAAIGAAALTAACLPRVPAALAIPRMREYETGTVGKMTKDGLKYFEVREGEGITPDWGYVCSIRFTMYGRSSPDAKMIKVDSSDFNGEPYLFKHGNGRQIKALEQGVHSMKIGGQRRIIAPPEMGYTVGGMWCANTCYK